LDNPAGLLVNDQEMIVFKDNLHLTTSIDLAPLDLVSGRGVGGEGFCTVV
jgi:hypothetical protein